MSAGDAGHGHDHSHVDPAELTPLDRYRAGVLARIRPLEPIELGLLEAHGCVLAEDVTAGEDLPGFANSAMDGYAVIAAASPEGAVLQVVGEAAAGGQAVREVLPGTSVRIMTGAPLPPGADAVVPVELTTEEGETVRLHAAPSPGDHVRPAGESVRAGTTVLRAGHLLTPAAVGLLAALGCARVRVHPRPRVAVIPTGDELVDADGRPGPGQIRDANSYSLVAQAREAGAVGFRHAIARDDRRALAEAFEGALSHADVLVTSGGVSAGRYDLVKEVLAGMGDVAFTKVAMQPGMPQAFGFVGSAAGSGAGSPTTGSAGRPGGSGAAGVPCFGLPGNPVSAFVSFEIFVRPALRRLQGRRDLNRPRIVAALEEPVRSPAHKVSFLRVRLRRNGGGWLAQPTGAQGSGILTSVVEADGLAEIPADRTSLAAGEGVVVHLLVDAS